jgi:hypothetical protein
MEMDQVVEQMSMHDRLMLVKKQKSKKTTEKCDVGRGDRGIGEGQLGLQAEGNQVIHATGEGAAFVGESPAKRSRLSKMQQDTLTRPRVRPVRRNECAGMEPPRVGEPLDS